jgi:hypothetical protein
VARGLQERPRGGRDVEHGGRGGAGGSCQGGRDQLPAGWLPGQPQGVIARGQRIPRRARQRQHLHAGDQHDGDARGDHRVGYPGADLPGSLLLGISVKTISFRDRATGNFQKNLTNRRGDMLIEAVTLHRRFPYAVLMGLLFLDKDARTDGTPKRKPTFENAFPRLRLFTGRSDPAGRDEQFERLYLVLVDANPFNPTYDVYQVSDPTKSVPLDDVMREAVELVAERNFDLYEEDKAGNIRKV